MKIIFFTLSILLSLNIFAATNLAGFSFQPIVGIERVQKISPTEHTKERLAYGFRAIYGPSFLSLEAEALKGEDTEKFTAEQLTIKEESIAVKFGLRSSFNLIFLRWFIRAGGHARQRKLTKTQYISANNETVTKTEPAIKLSPYAGTGFRFNITNKFFINGGITAIFTGEPKGSDREYQVDLGSGISF